MQDTKVDNDIDSADFITTRLESVLDDSTTFVTIKNPDVPLINTESSALVPRSGQSPKEIELLEQSDDGEIVIPNAHIELKSPTTDIDIRIAPGLGFTFTGHHDDIIEPVRNIVNSENGHSSIQHKSNHEETLYTATSPSPAGRVYSTEIIASASAPNIGRVDVTEYGGTTVHTFDDSQLNQRAETVTNVGIEEVPRDGDHSVSCPVCSEPFDRNTWGKLGGFGDRSGSMTKYGCPDTDCDGEIKVHV